MKCVLGLDLTCEECDFTNRCDECVPEELDDS